MLLRPFIANGIPSAQAARESSETAIRSEVELAGFMGMSVAAIGWVPAVGRAGAS